MLLIGVCVVAFSFLSTSTAHAQVSGATLSGTVTDSSNSVVPNATVAVLDVDKGVTRTVTTDADGFYSAPNLVPGSYKVNVTAQGFQTYVHSGIQLTVGEKQVLNVSMTVGQISQQVQVTSEAPVVELQSSAVGATLTSQTAVELPLNGRDWTALAALQPSVANLSALQQPIGSTSVRANRGFGLQLAVAGTRPQLNNYRIDGISAIDAVGGSPGSVLGVALGVDAIGEFSVVTSNYSAEYGRTAGGVINAVTKSGTNQFHGDAYWFIRDEGFDARAFNDPVTGLPPFHRNQFGGSAGMPIQKNKTFIFGDYEGFRQDLGATANNTVPVDDVRNGKINFASPANFPSGCVADGTPNQCQIAINPKMKPFLAFWPEPTPGAGFASGSFNNIANFIQTTNTIFKEDFVTARLDHKFSDKDSAFVTYLYDNGLTDQPSPLNLWTFGNTSVRQFLSIEETHVFSPSLVNSVRAGLNRTNPFAGAGISTINPLAGDHTLAAFPGLWCPSGAMPGTTGFTCFNGNTIIHPVFNSFQAYDDAFLTKGVHSLKFGFAFERMQTNTSIILTPNGAYSFGTSIAAWLTNQPINFSGASPTGRSELGIRQSLFGGYIQDDWRIRKNLTLNLGLRYEMVTVPVEVQNRLSNLSSFTATSPNLGSPFFNNPTKRNFAPRVGLAWDPFGDGKTSVRAAYGIFDVLPLNYFFTWGEARTAPFTQTISYSDKTTLDAFPGGPFPNGGPILALANNAVAAFQYNFVQSNPPRSYQEIWNLSIQRQLTPSTSMTVGYVGSHGVHLINREEEFNEVQGTLNPSGLLWPTTQQSVPNTSVGQIVGDYWAGVSSYNALTAQVTKRMSHGFQVQGSYTFGKSMDTGSSSSLSDNFLNSIVNLHWYCTPCRRSLSDFDIKHTIVVNFIWDLPTPKRGGALASHVLGGWEAGSIITARSGAPFTPTISGDPLGERGAAPIDYPSYSGASGCDTLTNNRSAQAYIKLNCFALPSSANLTTQGSCVAFATVPGTCRNLSGNVGRNSIIGPGQVTWDLSAFKNNHITRISETFNAQFRAEFFNILNRRNMGLPTATLFQGDGSPFPNAGVINTTSSTARQIQFALKVIW
jgi:hypothetical protein